MKKTTSKRLRSLSANPWASIVGVWCLTATGCGAAIDTPGGNNAAPAQQTYGTLLASVTTSPEHVVEFVELEPGSIVIAEGMPTGDKKLIGDETQSMSLANVFRMIQPHQPVPQAILDADLRLTTARKSQVHAERGYAPAAPSPSSVAQPKLYDFFYDQFCAPSNNVDCYEGRTGSLSGDVVPGTWFQTAGLVDGASPRGTFGGLNLNEWQCGSTCAWHVVYSHLILPGNYWYLTRITGPLTWHFGQLNAPSNALTSFAEQSERPTITATQFAVNEFDYTVTGFYGAQDVYIHLDNLPPPNSPSREVSLGGPVVSGTFSGRSGILGCNPGTSNPGRNPITIRAVSNDGTETALLPNWIQWGCY
jgi:hypothetical protein